MVLSIPLLNNHNYIFNYVASLGIWTLTETGMHCLDTIWQGDTDDLVDCQTHCETVGARKLTFIDNPHFGDYCQCCTESSELETGENNEFVYTYQGK